MKNSNIQWTDHTFNPWRGCTKISDGCKNCYAEAGSHRNPIVLGEWGPNANRVIAAESYWRQPIRWDIDARELGQRLRVFCASLADVFEDRDDLLPHRTRLLQHVMRTRNLDWLLLTKRPDKAKQLLKKGGWDESLFAQPPFRHVWLGASVEDQPNADFRLRALRDVPAVTRFLSVEPLLGPVKFQSLEGIHWVIIGGESGSEARECHIDLIQSIVEQCKAAKVAVFVKQLGAAPAADGPGDSRFILSLTDKKGGDATEFPPHLRVREFPNARGA
jgi:protein gp37